jgi:biopolymer transport protein ExbD
VKLLIIGISFVLAGSGGLACRRAQPTASTATGRVLPAPDTPRATIWVGKDGTIELDGQPSSLDAVETKLAALAQVKGTVLYGRDAAAEEPHPNGMTVIKMVVSHRLPIRMSTKRDFSDAVGPDGKIRQ